MNRGFIRQCFQLSLIWTIIALVPVGRVYLFSDKLQAWFYIIILLCGLVAGPVLLLWLDLLQTKLHSWIKIIIIQFVISILLSLGFHYAIDESQKIKRRISMKELNEMPVIQKAASTIFSGNSYTIFTSLMMLSGLALLIIYNEQLRKKKIEENSLKLSLVESQIKVLQTEFQPHFIFNTLHSASSLMESDVDKAQLLLEQFSFLLRKYLNIINQQFYSLREEMEFVKEYIEVQQLRHNGIIDLNVQVAHECLLLNVPVILMQPIIENSIKHGWTNRKSVLQISIVAQVIDGVLQISISDNGNALDIPERSGIGIRNLKERLQVLYNNSFSLEEINNNGYCTNISLPIKK